jgi:hypothetical protein
MILRCHKCKREKETDILSYVPENCALVVSVCPDCPGDMSDEDYFDAEGRQIDCDGNLLHNTEASRDEGGAK